MFDELKTHYALGREALFREKADEGWVICRLSPRTEVRRQVFSSWKSGISSSGLRKLSSTIPFPQYHAYVFAMPDCPTTSPLILTGKGSLVFISGQPVANRFRLGPQPCSSRSLLHGRRCHFPGFRRLSRLRCKLSDDQGEGLKTPSGKDASNFFVTYESWRNPTWLRELQTNRHASQTDARLRRRPAIPFFQIPKEHRMLRLTCTLSMLSFMGILSLAYVRLNHFTHKKLRAVVSSGLNRELYVGRVARCNPFTGISLRDVSLPKSEANPTAPVISAGRVDITLSGLMRSIFMRRALLINIRLDDAVIRISQTVSEGPKGQPVGHWDPGIYTSVPDSKFADNVSLASLRRILQFIQPGALSIRNAHVFFQPADFLDYGHGDEVVEVKDARADVTFPVFETSGGKGSSVTMDGNFKADVRGTPIDGGFIEVQCQMNGNKLPNLKPEDVVLSLRVAGDGIRADKVASFLSLPFRADEGFCAADISMDFLFKSQSLVPLMRGEAHLEAVGLRFHPDPKTPAFHNINGKLRFEGKTLFLDGPVGNLGTLPMTVVGNIHLEDGYNLVGYVRPIDVNNIIETFDVERFVPVAGLVSGEAELTGPLEEPVITGFAEAVSDESVFDRLPLKNANVSFEWDAIAGLLKFSRISGTVKGNGVVSGSGCMYFDMTKDSPYGIRQKVHSSRSPKALYWNPEADSSGSPPLHPEPVDEFEIDEHAPCRPYDSMRFDFEVTDVHGGDLLRYYGGVYGNKAAQSIGLASGKGIIAGHVKDANCRAVWKSTSPPPPIALNSTDLPESKSTDIAVAGNAAEMRNPTQPENGVKQEPGELRSRNSQSMLGGGEFKGLVYLKLGDLPEARRVKVRTTVKNFDARRAGWADPYLRKALKNAPLLQASADTYFKGVMYQRPLIPPGQFKVPRTPRMELLGADGALAVRKLNLNNVRFEKVMNGSFSFSTSDFSLSLKEVTGKFANRKDQAPDANERELPRAVLNLQDELTLAASLKGKANLRFCRGSSEITASVVRDKQGQQLADLFARNVAVQEFVGEDKDFSSGETLAGTLNADMNLNLTTRTGEGSLSLDQPRVGSLGFSSVSGNVVWRDQDVFLEGGTVKYRRSEYQIDARYSGNISGGPEFGWEVNVNIPRASIRDVAKLIQSGNSVATAMQSPADTISQGRQRHSGGPVWIQKLAESSVAELGTVVDEWAVPDGLDFGQEMAWFLQYLEDQKDIARRRKREVLDGAILDSRPTLSDVQGNVSGRISLRYNSRLGEERRSVSGVNALLQAILDQLTRTTFSFELTGDDWSIGPARVRQVDASGTFEDGVLNVGPLSFQGKDGFKAEARGRITSAGSVKGSAFIKKAPAALVNEYGQAPVNVTGECDARLEIEGNLSNPRVFGRAVWTGATLNGKQVRGAKTDLACVNGRCILNVDAKVGGRKPPTQKESDALAVESLNWGETLITGLRDLASQVESRTERAILTSSKAEKRDLGESLEVRISAPVRFYLLKYLQRRAPGIFWSEVEPVLGGSMPSDDEWILIDVDVKKYGLILLNTVLPELGWESGDSDIFLRVSGTLQRPIMKGKISLADGKLSPPVLSEPLQNLRGELEVSEQGLVSAKSISARCAGRSVSASGDLFISERHRQSLSAEVLNNQVALDGLKSRDARSRKARKLLVARQNDSKSTLQKGARGISLDFGDFPVNLQNIVLSKLSGSVCLNGTLTKPFLGGALTFSDGLIFLGNAAGPPRVSAENRLPSVARSSKAFSNFAGVRKQPTTGKRSTIAGWENGNDAGMLTKEDGLDFGDVTLDGLRVYLGRDMQVVQPFVLNVDTTGSIRMNGSGSNPEVFGEVKLLRGSVNVLATRMSIRKNEKNYLKFLKPDEGGKPGQEQSPEPIIKVALEDENLLVRIPECGISTWGDHIEVSDKSGAQLEVEKIGTLLEGIRSREAVQRLLASYVVNAIGVGGKAGRFEWRVFPSLVSRTGGLIKEGRLIDELGAGASFEYGGLSVANSISLNGTRSSKIGLRFWDWFSFELSSEGMKQTSSIGIRIQPGRRDSEDEADEDIEQRGNSYTIEMMEEEALKTKGTDVAPSIAPRKLSDQDRAKVDHNEERQSQTDDPEPAQSQPNAGDSAAGTIRKTPVAEDINGRTKQRGLPSGSAK